MPLGCLLTLPSLTTPCALIGLISCVCPGPAQRRRAERAPPGGGPALDRRPPGAARGRGALRQHRLARAALLHGGRPGGERGGPDRGDVPLARPAGGDLLGLRRRRRRAAPPPRLAGPLRAARGAPPRGVVHDRPGRGLTVPSVSV